MTRSRELIQLPASPDLSFEIPLWNQGITLVAGIDEAGRGAWAGPVAAAAVILPPDPTILIRLNGVNDSKKLTSIQRERYADQIKSECSAWGVGMASAQEIDQMGILPATHLAAQRALAACNLIAEYLLTDYLKIPRISLPQLPLVKGDARSLSIAAASILAKTSRDQMMCEMAEVYPGYGFSSHKGYGTAHHIQKLQESGPCPIHRMSFKPLQPVLFD